MATKSTFGKTFISFNSNFVFNIDLVSKVSQFNGKKCEKLSAKEYKYIFTRTQWIFTVLRVFAKQNTEHIHTLKHIVDLGLCYYYIY